MSNTLTSVENTEVNLKYKSHEKRNNHNTIADERLDERRECIFILWIDHDVKKNSFSDCEHVL